MMKRAIVELGSTEEPEIEPYVDGWWSQPSSTEDTASSAHKNTVENFIYSFCCFQ